MLQPDYVEVQQAEALQASPWLVLPGWFVFAERVVCRQAWEAGVVVNGPGGGLMILMMQPEMRSA